MHRRPTTGWGSTRRLGPRGRRAARGGVTREPRRGDCCRAVRTSVVPRASLPPPLRAGANGCGSYGKPRGRAFLPPECSRSAHGAPRRLSAGGRAARARRSQALPPQESRRGVPHGPSGVRASTSNARTTNKAESIPPPPQHYSGARVRLPVDLFEAFDAGVRVDLRRADARMTEQFLHRSQIGAAVYQMRGE